MKRFFLFLLLLPSLAQAAETANAIKIPQRNAANTRFVERNVVGVEDSVLGFNSSLEPVGLSLSADLAVSGGVIGLGNTTVTPGTYGSGTYSARVTVDAKGRITAIEEIEIEGGGGGDVSLTGTNTYTSGTSTFNSGTTVAVNGTFGGTPTGGTLDLSAVGVTLGTVTAGTLNVTAFGTGTLLGANGGTGVANTGKTITLGGNLTTSGAHATTFTTTGTTGVTLPTSGTLATTAQITGTNSGTNTGDQNIFGSVAVSGQTTVTTASTSQALTLVAGSGMTITTDNTAKSVTLASSGGGDSIPANGLILWPTASLGSLPSGFLEADGTEGTLDMTAIEAGTWIQKTTGIAPTLSSATIGTNGTTCTMVFSETVDIGAGGNGGFVPTMATGSPTLSYASGDGSNTLIYTLSSTVIDTTTGTLAYTQPGDGIEDTVNLDLASFSGTAIVNNSTEVGGGATAFITGTPGGSENNASSGEKGFKFTVAGASITISELGYKRVSGTYTSFTIRLYDSDGTTVLATAAPGYDSVAVGEWAYAAITPVVVPASGVRHIRILTTASNGFQRSAGTGGFTTTAVATINDPSDATGSTADGDVAFVDFKYSL